MSKQFLSNAYFSINSAVLSDHVKSITFSPKADALENTAMGATTHTFQPGLLDYGFSVELYNDEASSETEATLAAILAGGAAVPFEIRPDAGSVSATNPKWTGNVMLESYDAISGSVGQMGMTKANFKPAGTITRGTA